MAAKPSMDKEQYCKAIDKLGFSQVGIAPHIGVSRRQAQRFATGEAPVPESVAKLLRMAIKTKTDLRTV